MILPPLSEKGLVRLSDKLDEEVEKDIRVKKAVAIKEKELAEIYEIERAASSLAALLEAQKEKRERFESEMALKKVNLEQEIQTLREA